MPINQNTVSFEQMSVNSDISDIQSSVTECLTDYDECSDYNNLTDDDNIEQYKSIYSSEKHFLDSEKQDGQYVIGISSVNLEMNLELFLCGISAKTFFQFPYHEVIDYLFHYSLILLEDDPKLDIIQIHRDNTDTYIPIKKTYWLSIIQRHWKKIYKTKQTILLKRNYLMNIIYFHSFGNYPKELNELPSIKGMLSIY